MALDRAIIEYDIFVTQTRAKDMDRVPSVVIRAAGFWCCAWTRNQLYGLGRDQRLSDICIVAHPIHNAYQVRRCPTAYLARIQMAVEKVCTSKTKQRCYKVFPNPEFEAYVKDLPEGFLTAQELKEAMDLIRNGI